MSIRVLGKVWIDLHSLSRMCFSGLRCIVPEYSHLLSPVSKHFPCALSRSYVAAAYVKWVEMAGARAVPIRHACTNPLPQCSCLHKHNMAELVFALCINVERLLCLTQTVACRRFYVSDNELRRLFESVNGVILPVRTFTSTLLGLCVLAVIRWGILARTVARDMWLGRPRCGDKLT